MTQMIGERQKPYITLNAFGHYVMTKDARERRKILRDMKFPKAGKPTQYSAALAPILRCLIHPSRDVSTIHQAIERLQSEVPKNDHDATRRRICCEALNCFLSSLESFTHRGLQVTKSHLERHRVRVGDVRIGCRPELVIRGMVGKKQVVGAIKIRLSQEPVFSDEAGALCATVLHSLVKSELMTEGDTAELEFCQVIDVCNQCRVHVAPKAVKRRRAQVEETCEEIASQWSRITRLPARVSG